MVSVRVLKLDKNELTRLPEELYDIKIIQELTFQQNNVAVLSRAQDRAGNSSS